MRASEFPKTVWIVFEVWSGSELGVIDVYATEALAQEAVTAMGPRQVGQGDLEIQAWEVRS